VLGLRASLLGRLDCDVSQAATSPSASIRLQRERDEVFASLASAEAQSRVDTISKTLIE